MGWGNTRGWNSSDGNGYYGLKAAAALPTLTPIGVNTPTTSGANATVTGANIGTASADRLVVVAVSDMFGNNANGALTIGGVTATKVAEGAGNGASNYLFQLSVPTGTSADIVFTAGFFGAYGSPIISVYTLTGLSSQTATGSGQNIGSGASIATTVNTSAGGVIITSASAQDTAVTGLSGTETFVPDSSNPSGNVEIFGHAINTATSASNSITAAFSSAGPASIAAGAWR